MPTKAGNYFGFYFIEIEKYKRNPCANKYITIQRHSNTLGVRILSIVVHHQDAIFEILLSLISVLQALLILRRYNNDTKFIHETPMPHIICPKI